MSNVRRHKSGHRPAVPQSKAIVIAFLVAPLLPATVLAAFGPGFTNETLGVRLGFAFVFYWAALSVSLLIGGPVFWLLRRNGLIY
jgi:hypothetical protein